MEGFKKIDLAPARSSRLSSNTSVNTMSKRRGLRLNTRNKKTIIIAGCIIGLFLLSSVFAIVLPAQKLSVSAKKTITQVKLTVDAMKKQNLDLASTELVQTRADLTETQNAMNGMGALRFLPFGAGYYNDGQHLISAGFHALDAADILVASVKPYADVLGLKGKGSFVGGSAEQRIQTAVGTMGKITPRIDDIAKDLALVRADIDAVDPNHYPSFLGGAGVKTNLVAAKKYTDQADSFVSQARPLIKILPSLLGEPDAKRYLIIFQNDKELRPTGGFITAYAIFHIEHGVIKVEKSSDIYTLDENIRNKPKAPAPLQTYLTNYQSDPRLNIRDTNLSPDFEASMDLFNELYKNSSEYQKVDGIVGVDTQALVSAMDILGDIQVDGDTFTTKIDPHCNCPQVIYKLESYADQPVGHVRDNRKGIIGDLMFAIMSKAFSSSPKLYWGPLFQTMLTQVQQKHILFDLYSADANQGLGALGATGQIVPFDGDYLHINEANFGGAKSNLYVNETVDQKYTVQSDGTIEKTVTIHYKNPFAPSDCNLERGGLCLNATLRDWLRIYVPKGSIMMDSKGSEVKVTTYDELGKTVFDGFLTVRPKGAATFTITYRLPFKLSNGTLPLLIQKQPGTNDNSYTITTNGVTGTAFSLLTDHTEKLKL